LFRTIIELASELGFEEHDELAATGTVLRSAKGEHIDTSSPCDFLRRAAEPCDSVCKARTVHVHEHRTLTRELYDAHDFVRRVHGSELRRLRNADHARLRRMQFALFQERSRDFAEIKFAIRASCREQL